jgi:NAD(P)-dependent dehydrogenase (short-subunit alcohol dehydrogenase family)
MTERTSSPVFIVTGASRGIGQAMVRELLYRGARGLRVANARHVDGGYLALGL